MKKIVFSITFLLFSFILARQNIHANAFESNYDIYYLASSDGKIKVTQNIYIINKLSNIYASQYSLTLKDIEIGNIRVEDNRGPLKADISQTNESTSIIVHFDQPAVGVSQKQSFKINYDVLNLAKKRGQIWEVNIPKLAKENLIDSYNLTLEIPDDFGVLSAVKPIPVETKRLTNSTIYKFNKEQLTNAGINASFGLFQIFDFKLSYQIKNKSSISDYYKIALPPDTPFQKVYYKNINPEPINVEEDQDGNWLAIYKLKPQEGLDIIAQGKVRIFSEAQENSLLNSKNNLQNYLSAAKYWESDDSKIKEIASELKTPRKIYDFVLKNLSYDYKRIGEGAERLGATKALENPDKSLCMEFTDLFIALSRAADIPAREINGFAYTTNSKIQSLESSTDILHSWPEYYDSVKETWVPIDPTWGKTTEGIDYFSKMDVYHFAFVIHGKDSVLPYPAGSYKIDDNEDKNIQVTFGEYEKAEPPAIKIIFNLPDRIFFGKKYQGNVMVKNFGQSAIYNTNVKIWAEGVKFKTKEEIIAVLPPGGFKELTMDIKSTNFFNFKKAKIFVKALNQTEAHSLKIGSIFLQIAIPVIIIILLMGGFFLTKRKFFVRN